MKIYQCEFCHKQFNRLFFLDRHYNRKNKCITELFVLSQDQCNETRMVQFEPKPILSEQNEPKTNPLRTDLEPKQNEPKTNPLRINLEQNEPKTNPLRTDLEPKQNEPKTNPIGKQNEPKTNPIRTDLEPKQNEPKTNPIGNDLESPKPTKNELELIYSVDNHSNKRTKKYKTDELLKEKFLPYNKYTKKHLLALLNKTL